MKLLLKRIAKKNLYTIGKLYIDGKYFADTIEDKDRGIKQTMPLEEITSIKVKNETAIPTGTYSVNMNIVSPKFKDRTWAKPYNGKIPRLINVPGFDGVLIHPGTDQNSTSGCIIVGQNKVVGRVINSQVTFKRLMSILPIKESITLTIE